GGWSSGARWMLPTPVLGVWVSVRASACDVRDLGLLCHPCCVERDRFVAGLHIVGVRLHGNGVAVEQRPRGGRLLRPRATEPTRDGRPDQRPFDGAFRVLDDA